MLLKVEDLYVSYGHVDALNGVSLEVEKGQIISIVGANGAGKTTLLNALSGIVKVKKGQILFEDKPLPQAAHNIVKSGITHVPEGRRVFAGLTTEENLIIGGISRKVSETKHIMARMYEIFPRLKERHSQQAGTMSGGEQQMLAIARGMMSNPKLLLLDEPSLGLAPIVVNQVFELIKEIRDMGYTILLVEQNAKQALKLSDYTYVMENGVIKMQGKSKELLKNAEIMSAYLGEKK